MTKFQASAEIIKVDETLGLIFGFAMISKLDGEPYVDSQNDHITDEAILKSSAEFMSDLRTGCVMHQRDVDGEVVESGQILFAFPLTEDIAKSLDIETRRHGLLVGFRPNDPEDLVKARSGEYRGFSIGGSVVESEQTSTS